MTDAPPGTKVMLLLTSSAGGLGAHGMAMGRHMDRERFDLTIGYGPGYPFDEELNRLPVRVMPFPLSRRINPLVNLRVVWQVMRVLRRERFDVIVTEGAIAGFVGRMAGWLARTPVRIFVIQLQAAHPHHAPAGRFVFRTVERMIDRITTHYVAVSEAMARYGVDNGIFVRDKVDVIYNGVALDDLRPSDPAAARRTLGLDPDTPVVGTLARFEPQKGLHDLVEAIPRVLAEVGDVQFMMGGEGPLREQLQQQCRALGVDHAVHWVGWVRNVPEAISAMDVYCMPSLWEGFGIAFAEAGAMERPVVATTVDGIPEVVADGETGLLVPPGNADALAASLIALLKDPARRRAMGEAGRRRVEAKFTVEEMVKRYESLFVRLCRAVDY